MIQFCSGNLRSAGCSMPGCSLLELPVLGIRVFRLLQLAPCKMTLPWCVSLGAPPQACSRDLSEVRGEKAQQSLATWHVATGTTFYSHRNALHLREGKEVGSIWWKRICEVTLESTQGEEEGGLECLGHTRMPTSSLCLRNMLLFLWLFQNQKPLPQLNKKVRLFI